MKVRMITTMALLSIMRLMKSFEKCYCTYFFLLAWKNHGLLIALCALMGTLLVVIVHAVDIGDFDDQVDEYGHEFFRSDGA